LVDRLGGDESKVLLETGLGMLAKSEGNYDEAIAHYERSYEIATRALGKDSLVAAQRLNNLATAYDLKGDFARAQKTLERALAIKRSALGAKHPSIAVSLINYSISLRHQGACEKAAATLKEAARVFEETGGKQSPLLAAVLQNLANVQEQMEQWGDAISN